jgi:hypothetical protein
MIEGIAMKKLILARALTTALAACNNAAEERRPTRPQPPPRRPPPPQRRRVPKRRRTAGTYEYEMDGKATTSVLRPMARTRHQDGKVDREGPVGRA